MFTSVPGYLLAVGGPVPDVLLLLLHAVFDSRSGSADSRRGARSDRAAEPGAAVGGQVMRPHVGPPTVFGGVPAGAELLL